MRKLNLNKWLITILITLSVAFASDQGKGQKNNSFREKALNVNAQLEVNNVKANIANNGWLFWGGGNSGYIIPHPVFSNNSSNTASIYAAGLWLAGNVGGVKKNSIANYRVDFTPGSYDKYIQDSVLYGEANDDYKVFFYYSQKQLDFLSKLKATTTSTAVLNWATAQLTFAAVNDTNYWIANAVPQGAPRNPPGDVATFCIYHDRHMARRALMAGLNTSREPLRVQVRQLAFGFDQSGPLDNNIFIKFEIINKNLVPIDSLYTTVWSDPDLGDGNDDFVGSDPSLGLGYCYNGTDNDKNYTGALGIAPPAVGYDFLQGPIINNVGTDIIERGGKFKVYINYDSPDDLVPGDNVIHDKKVLGATSFVFFNNGEEPANATQYHLMMRGLTKDGVIAPEQATALTDGKTTLANQLWWYNGDPEKRTGWIETADPNDRRLMLNSGPFTLGVSDGSFKYGDPGYASVVFAAFTSFGKTFTNSVTKLKKEDQIIQYTFDQAFEVQPIPPAPDVTVRTGDQKIGLIWESGTTLFNGQNVLTETYDIGGWKFEGYQLVQYKSVNDVGSENFKVVATYDLINGVTTITDLVVDEITGDEITVGVFKGTDSDVKHSLTIDRDLYSALSSQPLYNSRFYAFGLRAYAYNPNPPAGQTHLRYGDFASGINAIAPQKKQISNELTSSIGDVLTATKTSTDEVNGFTTISVYDPEGITGSTYEVKFSTLAASKFQAGYPGDTIKAGSTVWSLYKANVLVPSAHQVPLSLKNKEGFAYTRQYEGLAITVSGVVNPGWLHIYQTANASGLFPTAKPGALGSNGFPTDATNSDPVAGQQVANASIWVIHAAETGRTNYAAFVTRVMRNGWDDIINNDFEIRFVPGKTKDFNGATGMFDVPFQMWNITKNYQLLPLVLDDDASSTYNYRAGVDHSASAGNDDPTLERIYVDIPVNKSSPTAGYDEWVADADDHLTGIVGPELLGRLGLVNINGGDITAGVYNATMPENGTIFKLVGVKQYAPTTVLSITSPAKPKLGSNELAEKNIDFINVVPNPYYGRHDDEGKGVKFIKFTNLPQSANVNDASNNTTIKIYSLNGDLVKTIIHNTPSPENKWDLTNSKSVAVASGVYIAHIQLPLGKVKIIKMVVLQAVQQLTTY